MIKNQSNHKESIKRAVNKGYADSATALWDPAQPKPEIENIMNVFIVLKTQR